HGRARLLAHLPPDGLHRRVEGIHGSGRRRHRLDPRRDARRPVDRARRVVLDRLPLVHVLRPDPLRDPDSCSVRSADPAARPRRQPEGLMAEIPPRIGVDEWVARHGERVAGGRAAELRRAGERLPWWSLLAGFVAIVALVPAITGNEYVIRVGVTTLLFAL